jgi:hypothetical protein
MDDSVAMDDLLLLVSNARIGDTICTSASYRALAFPKISGLEKKPGRALATWLTWASHFDEHVARKLTVPVPSL